MDDSSDQSLLEKCVITECKRESKALCKCCHQNLCYQHFWEHNNIAASQFNLFKQEIQDINRRYRAINSHLLASKFKQLVRQWRLDCYTEVDRLYDKKCLEFNSYLDSNLAKQREQIGWVEEKINIGSDMECTDQTEIETIKANLNELNGRIDKFEKGNFTVAIIPLTLNEQLIQIEP